MKIIVIESGFSSTTANSKNEMNCNTKLRIGTDSNFTETAKMGTNSENSSSNYDIIGYPIIAVCIVYTVLLLIVISTLELLCTILVYLISYTWNKFCLYRLKSIRLHQLKNFLISVLSSKFFKNNLKLKHGHE